MLNIVCVEDEEDEVEMIRLALRRAGVEADLRRVCDESGLLRALAHGSDLVLCDHSMPGYSADRALALLARVHGGPPLVLVTRAIGEEAVVRLFRMGAADYVAKDKLALLPPVIQRVIEKRAQERERRLTAQRLADASARFRALSVRLIDAQERERASIARELHDGLGQLLTGTLIHLHAADRTADPERAPALRAQAVAMAEQALQQVKTLSFELRPAQLGLLGFVPALRAMLERKLGPAGVMWTLRVRGDCVAPEHPSRRAALRVLQQGLVNLLRHAQAHRVAVHLRFGEGERMTLTLADDGRGFDAAQKLSGPVNEGNVGLHGMMERAELAGASLRFRSRPGAGTVLRLTVGGPP
jgi:signal transduction histidine kinase